LDDDEFLERVESSLTYATHRQRYSKKIFSLSLIQLLYLFSSLWSQEKRKKKKERRKKHE
jgi:hypothetical protein